MMFFAGMDYQQDHIEAVIQMSVEEIANSILKSAEIVYEEVPIDIDKVLISYGFTFGVVSEFTDNEIVAGIAYSPKEQKQLKSHKYFIFQKDIPYRDRRYLMALAIVSYVKESKNSYYAKTLGKKVLVDNIEIYSENARIARAILMPQKSLSTLVLSPMIDRMMNQEKIDSVAKAFLVSNDMAKLRMSETGLI